MRGVGVAAVCLAVVTFATGCGSAKPSPPVPSVGVVFGTLAIYGGVMEVNHCGCRLEAGTVRLIGAHARRIDVNVGKSGRFFVRVPVGRYMVAAWLRRPMDWPIGSCVPLLSSRSSDRAIVVREGRRLHLRLGCVAA